MLRVLLLHQGKQAVAADRTAVSVTVNPTPVAGPAPPAEMVSTTCRSQTTLVVRVGCSPARLCSARCGRILTLLRVLCQGASATWEVRKVRRVERGTGAVGADPTWKDPSVTSEWGGKRVSLPLFFLSFVLHGCRS